MLRLGFQKSPLTTLKKILDSDEPLLSGSGEVNRECPEDVLTEWRGIVEKWKEDPEK